MLSVEKIERRARQLLKEAGIEKPPIDVRALARFLKATLRPVSADEDISGAIVREGSRITIGVNAAHHPNRKRFTIAHELGHLVLHDAAVQVDHRFTQVVSRDEIQLAALRSRISSEAVDPREIEANRFAAALLMPVDFLEASLEAHKLPLRDKDIARLATEYSVSVKAMTFRLVNLGVPVDMDVAG
jgi:Zn-dependent peptidase ImmA (M78 family)